MKFPTTLVFLTLSVTVCFSSGDQRCEEISIPMCRGIGYNYTSMPNTLHHDTQEEAGLEVHQFWPLVEIQCSADLRFFLCSIYVPICIPDYAGSIPACKSVCLRAKAGCAPLMRQYGFSWPERMQCDKFPQYGDPKNLCMDSRNGSLPENPAAVDTVPVTNTSIGDSPKQCKGKKCPAEEIPPQPQPADECGSCICRPPLIRLTAPGDPRFNRSIRIGDVDNCAMPCASPFFAEEEMRFASVWIVFWAAIAALSSALTFATFLIDRPRFRYPERPIIFLSACYVGLSLGYLIREVAGGPESVSCDGSIVRYGTAPPASNSVSGSASTSNPPCIVSFLLIYFFGQAAGVWWVILSLTWFLAAGRKWGSEAIARCAPYFHVAAWTIPAGQTAAALLLSAVDGDPVAGICHVGAQQTWPLRWLVLVPLGTHLILGGVFLLAGLAGLARIRRVLKDQGRPKAEKLEKLMIRIGVFSVLYAVPAAILLGCYTYEVAFREEWGRTLTCSSKNCSGGNPFKHQSHPDFSVFMLKYFMTLVVGITSGFWVWSHKTLHSWRRFYARLCGLSTHTPTLEQQQQQQQQQLLAVPPIPPLPQQAKGGSLVKQPMMQSVQSHLGSTYKAPPLSHV